MPSASSAVVWGGLFASGYLLCLGAHWLQRYLAGRRQRYIAFMKRVIRERCLPQYAVKRSGDRILLFRDGRCIGFVTQGEHPAYLVSQREEVLS